MNGQSAISAEQVSKSFRLFRERNQSLKSIAVRRRRAVYEEFLALDDVSVEVPWGTTFALVGDNGSGKSTLLKVLARILQPTAGTVAVRGKLAALLELGSGFHPELSGRDNIYLNGAILGLSKSELDSRLDDIIEFSGVEQFIDQPIKTYSSGMYVRLGFSVAINVEPEILLVDEVLAVGDAAFQDKCLDKFSAFRKEGRTVVLVSHSMGAVRQLCDQGVWLDHGTVRAQGSAASIATEYIDAVHAREGKGNDCGLRIADVRVLQDGRAARIDADRPFEISVDLERYAAGTDGTVSVAIMTQPGVVVADLNTPVGSAAVPSGAERIEAAVQLPGLSLAPGRYLVRVAVSPDGSEVPADRRLIHAEFDVGRTGEGAAPILAPSSTWSVTASS